MNVEYQIYAEYKLPNDIFSDLKKLLDHEENNKVLFNLELAGHIEEEFLILKTNKIIVNFFEKCANKFFIENIQESYEKQYEMKLDSLWMNKQKKYEFNPLHNHSGIVSFVCWIKIPYNLEDELNLSSYKKTKLPKNSFFEFVYIDIDGNLTFETIKVDKSYEGQCIFFNSNLHHQVYPFYTSNDYRISISGNFNKVLKKIKKKYFYS